MKRMLALLCAILMLASVAACGKTETVESTTTAASDATTASASVAQTAPAETEPPKAFDSVPEQNLGGEFHIRYAQADNCYEDFLA